MYLRTTTIIIILLSLITTSCISLPGTGSRFPTPIPARTITSNSLDIREVWRRRVGENFGGGSWYSVPLAAFSADLVILPISGQDETQLVALRAKDGEQIWTRTLKNPEFPGVPLAVDSIIADTRRVYAAVPFEILAFDLRDGKPVWDSRELPSHTGYVIFPLLQGHILQVYSHPKTTRVYNVNIDNGQIESVDEYAEGLVLKTSTAEYLNADKGFLRVDSQTGQVLWQAPIKDRVWTWPTIVSPDLMLFTAGYYPMSIGAINASSGQILWQTPFDRVSSLVAVNGRVYSLQRDAILVAQDARTGRQVGLVQFGDHPFSTSIMGYWVLAAPSMLFAYLVDSQELVAFSMR